MKKALKLIFIFSFLTVSAALAAEPNTELKGTVLDVDPIAGRIELKGQGEYFVTDNSILKNISRNDIVTAVVVVDKGDARIQSITKTGVASPESEGLPVGEAVQGVLNATGETAKFVTSPIQPVHDTAGEGVSAVTGGTGELVKDAKGPAVKQDF